MLTTKIEWHWDAPKQHKDFTPAFYVRLAALAMAIINFLENTISRIFQRFSQFYNRQKSHYVLNRYLNSSRKPFTPGYGLAKFSHIQDTLKDPVLLDIFRNNKPLPHRFGYAFDERVVEYPWVISKLSSSPSLLLDAGSTLNFESLALHPALASKDLTIYTLAPENRCYWYHNISYHYGDLRSLPFRDNYFDEIITISTLGHVGLDNRIYTGEKLPPDSIYLDANHAALELIRVLKPGGRLLGSVTFGKHQYIKLSDNSIFAEQFDDRLLSNFMSSFSNCSSRDLTFYRYDSDGWNIATMKKCSDREYFNVHQSNQFDPDNAAAARGVALFDITK